MAVLIFANGIIEGVEWIRPYLKRAEAVIAADGGGNHLARLGVRPDVVVGDGDSLDEETRAAWQAAGTVINAFEEDKDETDLELALIYAAGHWEGDILVFGALGGRLDQMLANVLLLAHPALEGRRVELVEPGQRAWLIQGRTVVAGQAGDRVSLIPLKGNAQIGRTEGLKWKLEDEVLFFGRARGISNKMLGETAVVEVAEGEVLLVHLWGEGL
jgi:thiamine pyrophosphokinase